MLVGTHCCHALQVTHPPTAATAAPSLAAFHADSEMAHVYSAVTRHHHRTWKELVAVWCAALGLYAAHWGQAFHILGKQAGTHVWHNAGDSTTISSRQRCNPVLGTCSATTATAGLFRASLTSVNSCTIPLLVLLLTSTPVMCVLLADTILQTTIGSATGYCHCATPCRMSQAGTGPTCPWYHSKGPEYTEAACSSVWRQPDVSGPCQQGPSLSAGLCCCVLMGFWLVRLLLLSGYYSAASS